MFRKWDSLGQSYTNSSKFLKKSICCSTCPILAPVHYCPHSLYAIPKACWTMGPSASLPLHISTIPRHRLLVTPGSECQVSTGLWAPLLPQQSPSEHISLGLQWLLVYLALAPVCTPSSRHSELQVHLGVSSSLSIFLLVQAFLYGATLAGYTSPPACMDSGAYGQIHLGRSLFAGSLSVHFICCLAVILVALGLSYFCSPESHALGPSSFPSRPTEVPLYA